MSERLLLIKNGEIITAEGRFHGDILCSGEKIVEITAARDAPEGAEVIDATGRYVFPGFIDPHVHITLPFMGTEAKDTWETAGKAALIGGTTTLIEMVCPGRDEEPLDALAHWQANAEGIAPCDYTFHMGVTRFDEGVEKQLRQIVAEHHITSFKVFLAYKGAFGISDEELYGILRLAAELGVIVTAHCENAELVAQLQAELVAEDKVGPEWHEPSRPTSVEATGCHHFLTFAKLTGAHVYIVHTSCKDAVKVIQNAQKKGVKAWVETVAPYLVLDKSAAELPDFEGAKYIMSPPLREKHHQEFLWKSLADGTIATVGTDHAPFDFETQKRMGDPASGGNFTTIPNGIPSVEERIKLLYTYGVAKKRITLETLVRCASSEAARIFGLYPAKGAIAVGSDADLVIWDPSYEGVISQESQTMATDYSAFEGMNTIGRAETVILRGRTVVVRGEFTGKAPEGRHLHRSPGYL